LNQLLVLSTSTSSSNNSYGIDCNRQGSTWSYASEIEL